jgi:hypothetical protein
LKSYNGFSGEQRRRAQSWLIVQWRSGAITRPLDCCACGQTTQPIDAHAEDYSEPFRKGITDGFHLCYVCHMMVHCRHLSQDAWSTYRHMVENGGRAIPVGGRNFPVFRQRFLIGDITPSLFNWFTPLKRRALREIEVSQDEALRACAP